MRRNNARKARKEGEKISEFDEAWGKSLRLMVLESEQELQESRANSVEGKYVDARENRRRAEISAIKNYLTPPAKAKANKWRKPAFDAAREALHANPQISFKDLLDQVMMVAGVPEEEAVRRYLNCMGFEGKAGRPKKTPTPPFPKTKHRL